jgi:hypothetical protein
LPGQTPTFGYALTSTQIHPSLPQCLGEWGRDWGIEADPTARLTMAMEGPVIGEGMRQHLTDAEWYDHPVYEWIHERMRVTDIMPLMFRRSNGQDVTAWSLHRLDGCRPFSPREIQLGRLFVAEMLYLYETNRLEPVASRECELPPRLKEVLSRLLKAEPPKRIAFEMNISVHTVRDHIKRIYKRFGVSSQAELLALFMQP